MLPHHRTCKHAVLFYKDDAWLREQVTQHVTSALRSGRPAIVIAKPELLQELKIAIHREHVDGAPFGPRRGILVAIDAEETLAGICVAGRPDADRFMRIVGTAVKQLAGSGQVAAYGEMVGILCERGQYADAVHLEQLWNDLLDACDASLYCGYAHRLFRTRDSKAFLERIRAAHDDVQHDPLAVPALAA
jgi:hypothetical protein